MSAGISTPLGINRIHNFSVEDSDKVSTIVVNPI